MRVYVRLFRGIQAVCCESELDLLDSA